MDVTNYTEISLPIDHVRLVGELYIPPRAKALIVFSQNCGNNRFSFRNRQVAKYLQNRNFGTLLFDLLTPEEDTKKRMDIDLLTKRLIEVTEYLETLSSTKHIPIGYFGVSIGAASAIKASIKHPEVFGIVAKGGRLDLVGNDLAKVNVPILLIVGALNENTLRLNQVTFQELNCDKKLEVVPGTYNSFKELGAMEKGSELSTNWFKNYLPIQKAV